MKRIGIMGGTFNPIHNGHLYMAQAAYEQYQLDEVLFMPSKNPPHKKKKKIVSDEHRSRMIKMAIDGIPQFTFSDIELAREGTTYTCDTLLEIRRRHPNWEIYFILGGDSLESFDQWYHPEIILQNCTVLAAPRGELNAKALEKMCQKKSHDYHGKILPIQMERTDISSKLIRGRLKEGHSALFLCPEKTEHYIKLHGLYGSKKLKLKAEKKDSELLKCLSSTLRPKRYLHTLGVAETAASLAYCHLGDNEGIRRAELAGLLHDCAKYLTGEEMIALCEKNEIELSETEKKNTALIHGKLGAFYARCRYGVEDDEILSAIRYHTTGKPDMTTLEKIIYVADYIEPTRVMNCSPYPLQEVRKMCYLDLNQGLFMILANTIEYLSQSDREIDELSLETYEYYKNSDTKNN